MDSVLEPELNLIVGGARSGTTLLRLLLDAHPEIGCPAEAGVPALMSHMAAVWRTVDADLDDASVPADPGGHDAETPSDPKAKEPGVTLSEPRPVPIPMRTRDWIARTAIDVMRNYCERGNKRLYTDKSLDSVYHLDTVHQVFPKARYLLAVRHVMDTVASGIEASPWGFEAYGYGAYVQATPGNTVMALARYWLDHVATALEWEKRNPELCLRVRYEDLVTDPERTIAIVLRFLGVEEDLRVLASAFDRPATRGPGDYKVEHTSSIHAASIGHGKRIPVSMIPPPLLSEINAKLEELGYEPLGPSWNTSERPITNTRSTVWSDRLEALIDATELPDIPAPSSELQVFALVTEDHREHRWVFDTESRTVIRGDGEVDAVLTGTAEDLVLMLTEQENLGVLLRSGRVRHLIADQEQPQGRRATEEAASIAKYLQQSVKNT